jgi:hypothetical protein
MEVREMSKKLKNSLPPQERDALVKKMRAEDDKIKTGMFEFLDAQGGWFEFSYRKYPGESIKIIKLIHGEICDLPMGIIRHLNNSKRKVRRYSQEIAASGAKPVRSFETISRLRFTPMDVL